eukprot:229051_1
MGRSQLLLLLISMLSINSAYGASNTSLNFNINLGTFLGSSGTNQLYPVAVDLLTDGTVLVAGNGQYTFGLSNSYIEGLSNSSSNSKSNGTILVIDPKTLKPSKLIKISDSIYDLTVNRKTNDFVIAGSFGIAIIKSDLTASFYVNSLSEFNFSSSTGICNSDGKTCKVNIANDNTVGAMIATNRLSQGYYEYAVLSAMDGKLLGIIFVRIVIAYIYVHIYKLGSSSTKANGFTSIAINSESKEFYYTEFYDSNTGKEPIVMPCMRVQNYALTQTYYSDYCFDAHELRNPAYKCNGDVADGRAEAIRVLSYNNKQYLYYLGRSDGGDTMYNCQSQNLNVSIDMVQIDSYTSPYNMGAQAISFYAQMDIKTGLVNYGQMNLGRLSSGKGNSLQSYEIDIDNDGNVYIMQEAACCIQNTNNVTVNNQHTGAYVGGDAVLQVLSSDFKQRLYWTRFTAATGASSCNAVDLGVSQRGKTGAMVITTGGNMILDKPFNGTKAPNNGEKMGYLVVFPTVA